LKYLRTSWKSLAKFLPVWGPEIVKQCCWFQQM
jgi:hypothetical protein